MGCGGRAARRALSCSRIALLQTGPPCVVRGRRRSCSPPTPLPKRMKAAQKGSPNISVSCSGAAAAKTAWGGCDCYRCMHSVGGRACASGLWRGAAVALQCTLSPRARACTAQCSCNSAPHPGARARPPPLVPAPSDAVAAPQQRPPP